MIQRRIQNRLNALLDQNPAVVLTGARQVGKTTLAIEIAALRDALYLDLERPHDAAKLQDIEQFCLANEDKLLILDEVHRVPGLFAPLRGIIDQRRRQGRKTEQFLLLGSASLDLLKQAGESLAGRIALLELNPLDVLETESEPLLLQTLWLRGGFPGSCLDTNDASSIEWRWNFIRTYLERDIPLFGPRIPAETLRRFWTMLAHNQGCLLNAAQIAGGLGVSGQTVGRYLDLLVDLLLVRRLQPWTVNAGKRLVKSPKVYVRDSGIVHALLDISDFNTLLGHPVVGYSWEGFVIENILAIAGDRPPRGFYRTSGGAEIDLVLEPAPGERWAIEIKHSLAPKVSKGFYSACKDIQATRKIVIYSGDDCFPMREGIEACSLLSILKQLESLSTDIS